MPQNDKEIDPPKPIVDIDALVTENKYLHERITQLQVEKEIVKRTLTKYKVNEKYFFTIESNILWSCVGCGLLYLSLNTIPVRGNGILIIKQIMLISLLQTLLENRNKNDPINFKKGFSDVMTQKQGQYSIISLRFKHIAWQCIIIILLFTVREFLDINSKTGLKRSSVAELKSLCLGLFEALNDKSIALQHQRKTNQYVINFA